MKTYLKILFNSEGDSPSEIKDLLFNMGFKAAKGIRFNDCEYILSLYWFNGSL